ncbi:hypothetical protein [Sphingomonas sp.]|uniref:hypothetical protein n=1 Tax=Sphingomonas sp. TaxID=28214 RepID=UPI003F6E8690
MSEHRQRMCDDFSNQLQMKVQELVNRELRVAGVVFDRPEIAMMTMELARGMALGWAAQCLMQAKPGVDASFLFDQLIPPFASSLVNAKPQVLARISDPTFRTQAEGSVR